MMRSSSDAGWVRGTVDDERPAGDKPLSTQTRPQFAAPAKKKRKTRPGRITQPERKRRRRKRQSRRQAFMMGAGIALGILLAVVVVLALDRDSEGPAAATVEPEPTPVVVEPETAAVDPAAQAAADAEAEAARLEEQRRAKEAQRDEERRKRKAKEDAAREEAARQEAARKEALARAAVDATPAPKAETAAERQRRLNEEERKARKAKEGSAGRSGSKGEGRTVESSTPSVKDGRSGTTAPNPLVTRLSAEHVPVRRATMGTSKTVTVTVDGPEDSKVTMYWGPHGGPHKTSVLAAQGSGVWKGTLTIDATVSGGLEYWIVVKHPNATPRVVALGRQSAPHQVAVY